jgi:nucleoside 2-deoxyribosyltransferase
MKFYLAGSYGRREELEGYAKELEALGHTVTSRWLSGAHDKEWGHLENQDPTSDACAPYAKLWSDEDLADVRDADVLILFADNHNVRGGKHFEAGYATALGKHVHVIGHAELTFHRIETVHIYPSWPDFLLRLREEMYWSHYIDGVTL